MVRSNVDRWRAKQNEVARARRKGKTSKRKRRSLVIWIVLLIVVVLMLVQLIFLLFRTANTVDTMDEHQDLEDLAHNMVKKKLRGDEKTKSYEAVDEKPPPSYRVDIPDQPNEYVPNIEQTGPDPDLESLMTRLRVALAPYQKRYFSSNYLDMSTIPEIPSCDDFTVTWEDSLPGYLGGCPTSGCTSFTSLEKAKEACVKNNMCGGITATDGVYELRSGRIPQESTTGEISYTRTNCHRTGSAEEVWETFRKTMEKALDDDDELHLSTMYKTREDSSVYLSISTYRDDTCPFTLKKAFERAKYPDRLFVGIVQQNCIADICYTGTGWANTRRWVRQDGKDVDCAEQFCKEHPDICEHQVRILRLPEEQAYGPFFGRFLNSKLYRGENIYVQIDAHTDFRQDWDYVLLDQLKRTPSYPYSVISNYPPSGDPRSGSAWDPPKDYSSEGTPSSLCGCSFEDAGGDHHTVRIQETRRSFSMGVDRNVPHHSCFVAAGFFAAHGSIFNEVKADPFMPMLFMGEEISLSIRFWTHGYDIYGPSVNVVQHSYVRKESAKFWESIGMVFSNGGIHNALTDLIIPRVQKLVGWKDPPARLASVYTRIEDYGLGTKRTAGQFVRTMNIMVRSLKQSAPSWCLKGLDMPTSTSSINNA